MKELFEKPASFSVVGDGIEIRQPQPDMKPSPPPFSHCDGVAWGGIYSNDSVTLLPPSDALELLAYLRENEEKLHKLAATRIALRKAQLEQLRKQVEA